MLLSRARKDSLLESVAAASRKDGVVVAGHQDHPPPTCAGRTPRTTTDMSCSVDGDMMGTFIFWEPQANESQKGLALKWLRNASSMCACIVIR